MFSNPKKETSKPSAKDPSPYLSGSWTQNLRFSYLHPFFDKANACAKTKKPLECKFFLRIL